VWVDAEPNQDGGGTNPVPADWPTLLQVRCSKKKKAPAEGYPPTGAGYWQGKITPWPV